MEVGAEGCPLEEAVVEVEGCLPVEAGEEEEAVVEAEALLPEEAEGEEAVVEAAALP